MNFSISTNIQHDLPITRPKFGENRSKIKVTASRNVPR